MSNPSDRDRSIIWAQKALDDKFVILDTETTDLYNAEFVQIAVIDQRGVRLLDTLVKPEKPQRMINSGASDIHGITPADVENAPTFEDFYPTLVNILRDKRVMIYNERFDRPILDATCRRYKLGLIRAQYECVMLRYAAFVGEWNAYRNSYRWQKLPSGDHTAFGDCRATLDVMRTMAASETEKPF